MNYENQKLLSFKFHKNHGFLFSGKCANSNFCRESTKINPEKTKGKCMPTLHLAYIKSSARLAEVELCYVWLSFISHVNKTLSIQYQQCLYRSVAWFVVIFGVHTTSDISKFETVLKYHEVFMPNITNKSCYYLFILLPTKGL